MSQVLEKKFPIMIKIQISEPWDFDIGNGNNYFNGELFKTIIGEDEQEYYLVKIQIPFVWRDKKIKFITIIPSLGFRLTDLFKKNGNDNEVTVGIGRLIDETIILPQVKYFKFKQVEYFAYGSISLLKKHIQKWAKNRDL